MPVHENSVSYAVVTTNGEEQSIVLQQGIEPRLHGEQVGPWHNEKLEGSCTGRTKKNF